MQLCFERRAALGNRLRRATTDPLVRNYRMRYSDHLLTAYRERILERLEDAVKKNRANILFFEQDKTARHRAIGVRQRANCRTLV